MGLLGHTQCCTGPPMFPGNYAKGVKHTSGVRVDMHTCTDACTHSKQDVGPEVWDTYTVPQRGTHDSM